MELEKEEEKCEGEEERMIEKKVESKIFASLLDTHLIGSVIENICNIHPGTIPIFLNQVVQPIQSELLVVKEERFLSFMHDYQPYMFSF